MHSLLKFILKYSNFLVFLTLEVVAFLLIMHNQDYPHSSALSTANTIVGWSNQTVDNVANYFLLKRVNEELSAENAMLRNMLMEQANAEEDSIEHLPRYQYAHLQTRFMPAKVVDLTTDRPNNYLTINKGEADGVQNGAGVINNDGIVGIVRTVGEHFSVVIPTINTRSGISCRLKKNNYLGTVKWNGGNCHKADLIDIAPHIQVEVGDTVITSGLTPIFPAGIPVGIVENCELKKGANYYDIKLRLLTDYRRLEYVQILINPKADEQNKMQDGMD